MASELQNMKISGSGRVSGGHYDAIRISGSARVDGDVTCNSLHVSGSAHLDANIVAGECRVSGSAHIGGTIEAGTLHVSGSCHAERDLTASGELSISGGARVGGGLKAQKIRLSGSARVGAGIECEALEVSGSFDVSGLINAGTLRARLSGRSNADEIGGEEIIVVREHRRPAFRIFGVEISPFFGPLGSLTVNSVEGSRVHLEGAKAKIVRGETVEIGPGCEIGRVEYSGELTVDEGATVGERVKI
jgi:cytoskeletal protein CcmA (bactofilin family)